MTAREKQYVPGNPPHSANNSVRPGTDLLRRFASWTTVSEQVPVRTIPTLLSGITANLRAAAASTSVPNDLRDGTIPGQFACAARSLQWTRKHLRQKQSLKTLSEFPSVRSPNSVSGRSVSPVCCPDRLQAV